MIKLIVAMGLLSAAGLAGFGLSRGVSAVSAERLAPESGQVTDHLPQGDRDVSSVDDLIGAFLYVDKQGKRARIEEVVWGITEQGYLGFAKLKAVTDDGEVVDYNRPELYARIAYTPKELGGSSVKVSGDARATIDSISYYVDSLGNIGISTWVGKDATGKTFSLNRKLGTIDWFEEKDGVLVGVAQGAVCCGSAQAIECLPHPSCNGDCPGPGNCACTGAGSCWQLTSQICRGTCGGSSCPGIGSCGGSAPNCACS